MRAACPEDAVAIDAFLSAHADETMFLRSNLREHGPCGGPAPRATRIWLSESGGAIDAVLGLSTAGFVFAADWSDAAIAEAPHLLAGEAISGIIGPTDQVRALQRRLGLDKAPVRRDEDEPHYALDLNALVIPSGSSTLRIAGEPDTSFLIDWRRNYMHELFGLPQAEAAKQAAEQIPEMIASGRLAILESHGKPISMTAFNAVLPEIVQIGNVYTPPSLRGKHYARRAVALHLDHVRGAGIRRAVLSASGTAASRSYEAIGFRKVGRAMMMMFADRQIVKDR